MTRTEMKEKAKTLGLEFNGNIKNDDLAELIAQAEGNTEATEAVEVDAELIEAAKQAEEQLEKIITKVEDKSVPKPSGKKTPGQIKAEARRAAEKKSRCIVTPMDKDKAELKGEIISCGNSMTGFIKEYVPFGKEWHLRSIVIDTLKDKKMLSTRDRHTPKGVVKENIEIVQYNVQILPDLTQEELDRVVKEAK
jgi:hypothetical protein